MLPKINRADRATVDRIFKSYPPNGREGKIINSSVLNFRFILTHAAGVPRVSVLVPKNIAKMAVDRNSLRRQSYRILMDIIGQFPKGLIGIFVFKKYPDNSSIIDNDIKEILHKIN